MKRILLMLSLMLCSASYSMNIKGYQKLINAMIVVESSGNKYAIGDNGRSYGILQISKGYVECVNRRYATNYVHQDMFDPRISKMVCYGYLMMYGERYERVYKRKPTMEVLARMHNGGGSDGFLQQPTIKYWNKIKQQLEYRNGY